MKLWRTKTEWMAYASCQGDARFISESPDEDPDLEKICGACRVRPECIQWAVDNEVCAVYVAGVRLPDPAFGRVLRSVRNKLGRGVPDELARRGEDI